MQAGVSRTGWNRKEILVVPPAGVFRNIHHAVMQTEEAFCFGVMVKENGAREIVAFLSPRHSVCGSPQGNAKGRYVCQVVCGEAQNAVLFG